MKSKFETEIEKYRAELSNYLNSNCITLVEYAKALGEDYISPILYPRDDSELETAKKAFKMYKSIYESRKYTFYDREENYMLAVLQFALIGMNEKKYFEDLEKALYIIYSDSKLRGKLLSDTYTFSNNEKAYEEVIEMVFKECKSLEDPSVIVEKAEKIVSSIFNKVVMRVLIEKPEARKNIIPNPGIKGMRSYINLNQDMYGYIVSEKLDIPPYEKKLN